MGAAGRCGRCLAGGERLRRPGRSDRAGAERASPERRVSWDAAFAALGLPSDSREAAAAGDGELWAWRAAYERDLGWAPPYVAEELREAHLAADHYRAEAVLAWYRADAAADEGEWGTAVREAQEHSVLAHEVGAYREALTAVAEARRRWHTATEPDRQSAITADAELRRRHPEAEIPPLQLPEDTEAATMSAAATGKQGLAELPVTKRSGAADQEPAARTAAGRRDIAAAVEAARMAEAIIAEREQQAARDAHAVSDDVMRRRETEAHLRASAVRQDPEPSRSALSLEHAEPELEAGL